MVIVRALPWWNISPLRFVEFVRFWLILRTVDSSTIVVLQRTLRRPEFLWLVSFFRTRIPYIISDFDDAVWVHSPGSTEKILRLSDEVWCGSQVTHRYCAARHRNARFVPTTIDTDIFNASVTEEDIPIIGWVGDIHAHIENLRFFSTILRQIYRELPPFQLRLIGITTFQSELQKCFDFLGSNLEIIGWISPSEIPALISHFSIGIMPLEDTEFTRGKSALKIIEYLAAGVPVIASDVGENRHVIQPTKFGMTVTTVAEWRDAFLTLLVDQASRRCIGDQGRRVMQEKYDRSVVYGFLLDELERVAASGRLDNA